MAAGNADTYDAGALCIRAGNAAGAGRHMIPHTPLGGGRQLTPLALAQARGAALPWWNPDGATPAAITGAWQAKGAGTLANSYINLGLLGNPSIDPAIVGGVAPTFPDDTGWIFNGTTQYLKSGVPATDDGTYSAMTCLVQYSDYTAGICIFGVGWTTGGLWVRFDLKRYYNALGGLAASFGNSGNVGIAGQKGYADGVYDVATMNGAPIAAEMFVGAINSFGGGGANFFWAGKIQAIVFYDSVLTAPQVLARATAMAAL
jgi:hypothetical protein